MNETETQENKIEEKPSEGVPLSRVSTYQDAIKEALVSQEMSSSGMLMAEQRKRDDFKAEDEEKSISNPKNKILLVAAGILVILAIGVIVFSIINSNKKTPQETSFLKSKYFISEKMIEITSAQLSRNTLSKIQQATTDTVDAGAITQLIITKEVKRDPTSTFDFTKKVSYDTNDFLALLSARAPEELRRSFDPEFMLGVHKASLNETFVLFRVDNYENSYSAMFDWESSLARDMENVFPKAIESARIKTKEPKPIETTVTDLVGASSSTSTIEKIETVQKTIDNTRIWHDKVIKNTDARALLNQYGQVVFFYAFIDKEYIFFGTKEETFGEVMRRVRSSKLVI